MTFVYSRCVYFRDTDAAGVVYFANLLAIAHEAYEASLAASGVDLRRFFGGLDLAVPIVHASADFFRPLRCGDQLAVYLQPRQLGAGEFAIDYQMFTELELEQPAGLVQTRHVCIRVATRKRTDLTLELVNWLQQWGAEAAG